MRQPSGLYRPSPPPAPFHSPCVGLHGGTPLRITSTTTVRTKSNQSRVAVTTGTICSLTLQGFLHLDLGNTRIGNSRGSRRVENQTAAGAKWRCPMDVAGW